MEIVLQSFEFLGWVIERVLAIISQLVENTSKGEDIHLGASFLQLNYLWGNV